MGGEVQGFKAELIPAPRYQLSLPSRDPLPSNNLLSIASLQPAELPKVRSKAYRLTAANPKSGDVEEGQGNWLTTAGPKVKDREGEVTPGGPQSASRLEMGKRVKSSG